MVAYISLTFFSDSKIETMDYSPCFLPENKNFEFAGKRILLERASQEKHNGANFSFIAPSCEEL